MNLLEDYKNLLARLYFAGASLLLMFASYQVNLTTEILTKKDHLMPAHLERAFLAGCYLNKSKSCKSAAAQFRSEQERIYN